MSRDLNNNGLDLARSLFAAPRVILVPARADDTDEHARIMHRSKSRDSSPANHYVKAERLNDSSCDVGEDDDEYLPLGSQEADEEHGNGDTGPALIEQRRHRRKKISHSNSGGECRPIVHDISICS